MHDPRRRECSLASLTSFEFDGDRLAGITYSEPRLTSCPVLRVAVPDRIAV